MTWSCRTSQLRKLLETSSYILPPLQMVWRILIASLNFKASLGWHHSNTSFSQFTAKLKETLAWNRRLPSKSLCPKYRGCPPLLFSLNQVWDVSIWGSRIENELIMPKFWLPYIVLYQIALLTGPTDPKIASRNSVAKRLLRMGLSLSTWEELNSVTINWTSSFNKLNELHGDWFHGTMFQITRVDSNISQRQRQRAVPNCQASMINNGLSLDTSWIPSSERQRAKAQHWIDKGLPRALEMAHRCIHKNEII